MSEIDPVVREAYQELQRLSETQEMERRHQRFLIDKRLAIGAARKDGKIEDAQNMKRKGYPTEEISEITGLSVAEIERLACDP